MDFKEYQKNLEKLRFIRIGKNIVYPTLGLMGETGKLPRKLKILETITVL